MHRSILTRQRLVGIFLLGVVLLPGQTFCQRLYKYQDENGVWVFADRPPEDGQAYQEDELKPSFEPPAVVVSIASVIERNPIFRFSRLSTVSMSCFNERARRSSFQTTRVSPERM